MASSAELTTSTSTSTSTLNSNSSKIKSLNSKQEYVRAMNADGLTIIEGIASWCANCKAIAPEVSKLADEFSAKGASFYTFDVDAQPDIAHELGISSMPTFTIFKDGDIQESVSGAKPKVLRDTIEKNL